MDIKVFVHNRKIVPIQSPTFHCQLALLCQYHYHYSACAYCILLLLERLLLLLHLLLPTRNSVVAAATATATEDDNHHHGVNQGHGDNDGDNQIMLYHKPSVKFDLPVKDMMWYKTPGI